MAVKIPEFRIGEAIRHEALAVFPLFAEAARPVEYDLSDEAMGRGSVTVDEVSEAGSVPQLSVENKGELRVLFLEGEELVGAKQNRILNTSVLVAAHSKSRIPVSCVEAGRWSYRSGHFGSGGTHSPSGLRRVLKSSVSKSVRERRGYDSDQGGVWAEVARQQKALGASSDTRAMSDTFEAHRQRLDEFRKKLQYAEGAVGAAVAIGGRVVAIDVFDKPATCGKVWKRLLSGAVLDALEAGKTDTLAASSDVEQSLSRLRSLSWEAAAPVGEGEQYRAQSATGDYASALILADSLVHGSVVCARSLEDKA